MKIYVITEEPYHDNSTIYGAYDSIEKAREALRSFAIDPSTNWKPDTISVCELNASAKRRSPIWSNDTGLICEPEILP